MRFLSNDRLLFKYNPRKCSSASLFSDCAQRDQSKCLIALPTEVEHVRVFEKASIDNFSCVKTKLTFDTQILLNDKQKEKVVFDLKIDRKNKQSISSYTKMDENNQYGQVMTEALPYECIKRKQHLPNLIEFK